VKFCEICQHLLEKRRKRFCQACDEKLVEIQCPDCETPRLVSATYQFQKVPDSIAKCPSCLRQGSGSPRVLRKLETEKRKREQGYTRTYSEEGRKGIGEASAKKFTEEYKKKVRTHFENTGRWTKTEETDDYTLYRRLANWKNQPITEHTVGIEKLKISPLYSKDHKDKNALVRDHMFSRRQGFKEKVFPEILRHPANCQLISQLDNFNKGKKTQDSCMSLEDLIHRIEKWKLEYKEQTLVLEKIEAHKKGKRYEKETYIQNVYSY
jgi:hypothetical protein